MITSFVLVNLSQGQRFGKPCLEPDLSRPTTSTKAFNALSEEDRAMVKGRLVDLEMLKTIFSEKKRTVQEGQLQKYVDWQRKYNS